VTSGVLLLLAIGPTCVLHGQAPNDAATFEAASVKSNKSDEQERIRFTPGQLTITGMPLRAVISFAYIQEYRITGAPKWVDSERFDIVAKVAGRGSAQQVRVMLRTLLADRFKLDAHTETQEVPIFALVLAHPNGKLGDHLRRTGPACTRAPAEKSVANCAVALGAGRMAGREATLGQLAASLSRVVERLVVDRTGRDGRFDFDLEFTPPEGVRNPSESPDLLPADPDAPSIFTALEEQLGLKLDSTKGPVEVLVIDHVERPTED